MRHTSYCHKIFIFRSLLDVRLWENKHVVTVLPTIRVKMKQKILLEKIYDITTSSSDLTIIGPLSHLVQDFSWDILFSLQLESQY